MIGSRWKEKLPPMVIAAGIVVGAVSAILVKLGNPPNMGFCMACFERDIAGAVGLHRASVVQYLRPEIPGIILGAAISAFFGKETVARSGSSPAVRFILGMFVMIGALVFLGCPTRMVLRLGGGDGNALFGLAGFTIGIGIGTIYLRKGSSLGRSYREKFSVSSYIMPLLAVGGVILLFAKPSFIFFSEKGPGSMHAPILASLGAGILVGVLGQRSRLCFAGGIRDMILFRSSYLLSGMAGTLVGVFATNLIFGFFHMGFAGQPIAHSDQLWNLLSMLLVGLGSVMLGGCPFRQLVLSAQGNGDSIVTVMGMIAGAAVSQNFIAAASPAGVTPEGKIGVLLGIIVCLLVGLKTSEGLKRAV